MGSNGALTADAVRAELKQFLAARPDLAVTQIAAHTDLSDSACWGFARGDAGVGGPKVVTEIARVLGLARAGEILQPGASSRALVLADPEPRRRVAKKHEFYQTTVVRKVAQVLDYCAEQGTIGVVTGDFGVGKTEAVAAWRRASGRRRDCLVFEFDEFTAAGVVDFVHALAEALDVGVTSRGPQHGGRVFRAIVERLRESPCLLIFDQAETMRLRVAQVIRQIWDRTQDAGVGVVLLAAPVLLARLKGSRASDLGALESRIGVIAPLSGLAREEMASIVRQEGVGEVDEAALDLWWRATGGSMRRLMRSLEMITAKHAGRKVTERTVTDVAGFLWGLKVGA